MTCLTIPAVILALFVGGCAPATSEPAMYSPRPPIHAPVRAKKDEDIGAKLDRVIEQLDRVERETRPPWYKEPKNDPVE